MSLIGKKYSLYLVIVDFYMCKYNYVVDIEVRGSKLRVNGMWGSGNSKK